MASQKTIVRLKGSKIRRASLEASEKRKRALELRKAGASYDEIAKSVGYADGASAYNAIAKAVEKIQVEPVLERLMMDLEIFDDMQKRATVAMRQGDLSQIDRIIRIMEKRWAIMGVTPEVVRSLVNKKFGLEDTPLPQNGGVVNNVGIQLVQNSSVDFVRTIMLSLGVDPESPAAQRELQRIEEREGNSSAKKTAQKKKKVIRVRASQGRTVKALGKKKAVEKEKEWGTPTPPPFYIEGESYSQDFVQKEAGGGQGPYDTPYGEVVDAEIVEEYLPQESSE